MGRRLECGPIAACALGRPFVQRFDPPTMTRANAVTIVDGCSAGQVRNLLTMISLIQRCSQKEAADPGGEWVGGFSVA